MELSLLPFAFIEGIGGPEMVLILVIVLVLFGGDKLPEFAKGLGKSIREFKKAAGNVEQEFKRALEEEPKKYTPPPALPSSTPDTTLAPDYHSDPYHSDPHYHDGSEAGPSAPVTKELPAPASVPALEAPKVDPAPLAPHGAIVPPAAEAPKPDATQPDATQPGAAPVTPASPTTPPSPSPPAASTPPPEPKP